MSRSSPGVARVAAILNFIADHPGQAFALTDLVRALKLSRATCHALLTGLVDVGYLYRTTDKTYVLGPALAAIGRTAAAHFSPLQVAQPEMRSLADEFDVVCGAYFLEGDVIHLRERAASLSHIGYPVPLGTRMPLRWIQAMTFFARSARDADAWVSRADPPLGRSNSGSSVPGWSSSARMATSRCCGVRAARRNWAFGRAPKTRRSSRCLRSMCSGSIRSWR
ncbi:helix-turn-helix domain-containing protein [Novosphingobium resinovorum]